MIPIFLIIVLKLYLFVDFLFELMQIEVDLFIVLFSVDEVGCFGIGFEEDEPILQFLDTIKVSLTSLDRDLMDLIEDSS